MPSRSTRVFRHLANSAGLMLFLALAVPSRGQIQVLGVTSSANFAQGLTQAGSLASVFCTGLQNISGLVAAQGYPLPRALAGVTVTVNGADASILAIASIAAGSYQQINVQIPWEAKPPLAFAVSQQGATAHFTPSVYDGWGAFFVGSSGYAIAQHAGESSGTMGARTLGSAGYPSAGWFWLIGGEFPQPEEDESRHAAEAECHGILIAQALRDPGD